jgi:hypothetical protein
MGQISQIPINQVISGLTLSGLDVGQYNLSFSSPTLHTLNQSLIIQPGKFYLSCIEILKLSKASPFSVQVTKDGASSFNLKAQNFVAIDPILVCLMDQYNNIVNWNQLYSVTAQSNKPLVLSNSFKNISHILEFFLQYGFSVKFELSDTYTICFSLPNYWYLSTYF